MHTNLAPKIDDIKVRLPEHSSIENYEIDKNRIVNYVRRIIQSIVNYSYFTLHLDSWNVYSFNLKANLFVLHPGSEIMCTAIVQRIHLNNLHLVNFSFSVITNYLPFGDQTMSP